MAFLSPALAWRTALSSALLTQWLKSSFSSLSAIGFVVASTGNVLSSRWIGTTPRSFTSSCAYENKTPSSAAAAEQPQPQSLPFLMLPSKEDTVKASNYCFYSLAEEEVIRLNKKSNSKLPVGAECLGSSHGWVCYVDTLDSSLYLTNPLISPVPPTIPLPPVAANRRTTDTDSSITEYIKHCNDPQLRKPKIISKLVMSCPPHPAPPPSSPHDCTIMAIHGSLCELAFCKLGDESWTIVDQQTLQPYEELAYWSKDQLFYAINHKDGRVEAWDIRDPSCPKSTLVDAEVYWPCYDDEVWKRREEGYYHRQYLVECGGELLRVFRYFAKFDEEDNMVYGNGQDPLDEFPYETFSFDVFRLYKSCNKWKIVESLDDYVLFVGLTQSFSLSARDFPGILTPNSIYFLDDLTFKIDDEEYEYGGHDMGVYNKGENDLTHFYPIDDELRKIAPPPIWLAPKSS